MMTYEEAVRGLNGRGMFLGINSYEHTEELLRLLGEPQRSAGEILHIAGTNGKGSVTAFLESALRAAGNTTGRFISPHLVRVNERIAVNGTDISDRDFVRAYEAFVSVGNFSDNLSVRVKDQLGAVLIVGDDPFAPVDRFSASLEFIDDRLSERQQFRFCAKFTLDNRHSFFLRRFSGDCLFKLCHAAVPEFTGRVSAFDVGRRRGPRFTRDDKFVCRKIFWIGRQRFVKF